MAPKHKRKQTILSVNISGMFPANDPVALDVLRLMSGCNDTYFIEEWSNGTKQIPKEMGAMIIAVGRNAFQLRLMCSFLHESLCVIRDLTGREEFETLRTLFDNDGQKALSELLKIRLKGSDLSAKDWDVTDSILRARHTATFHYDFAKVQDALNKWVADHGSNEAAYILHRDRASMLANATYYAIADMARAEMSFGIGNPNFRKNLQTALDLLQYLHTFTDQLFHAYIRHRNLENYIRADTTPKTPVQSEI